MLEQLRQKLHKSFDTFVSKLEASQQMPTIKEDQKVINGTIDVMPVEDLRDDMIAASDYLQFSAEAVGYASREQQFNMYNAVGSHINVMEASIIDFGAGRGDFARWICSTYNTSPANINYIGLDFNENLVTASRDLGDEVDVRNIDWFLLDSDMRADWCINVNSSNLRYDANVNLSDREYLEKTIDVMVEHADIGAIISLSSDVSNVQDGLINWNPGDIFNWAVKKYGTVALDHSFSEHVFVLIIYKS